MEANPSIVNVPPSDLDMAAVLAKTPEQLSEEEVHFLIGRVGWLSDDERKRFASVLKRENLTPQEVWRYRHLQLLDRYFPAAGKE
jgi:hypothetical protein